MKLRIRGNSVRLRLGQSEVRTLAAGKRVEGITQFSSASQFSYSIEAVAGGEVSAVFESARILVRVPRAQVEHWAVTDQVGIEARQAVDGDASLKILIEKDFECGNPDESQADAFPNPNKCE